MDWIILLLVLVLAIVHFMDLKGKEHFRGGGGGGGGGGRGGGGGMGRGGGFGGGMGRAGGYGGASGNFGDYDRTASNAIGSNSIGVYPTYGFNRQVGYPGTSSYADKVAYDLQNPFPSVNYEEEDGDGYADAPWDPYTYRNVMEPDGQIVGKIVAN
jgi:hypothetical protein